MDKEYNWNKLYKIAGLSALMIVLIIPIQILIFSLFPPPDDSIGFITLFHDNWLLGLLSLDLLYYFNNALLALFYLGLFASMRKIDYTNMLIALIIGLIGIAVYYASSIGFEMLALSNQYYQTDSVEFKQQLVSVGHGLILKYKGTAFDVYYVFNAIALILIAKTMFNSKEFGKAAAIWGLIAGLFMIIPSTAGTIGLIFSLISLIPWIVFSIIVGRKMLIIAKI
ncbi:hypothetical protein MASR1M74_31280 [Lentimicrobium sp.]